MSKGLKAIEEIKDVFNLIIGKNKALTDQTQMLTEKVKKLEGDIRSKSDKIDELNKDYKMLKMTKKLEGSDTVSNKELKLKINEMVREIDQCIAQLNK